MNNSCPELFTYDEQHLLYSLSETILKSKFETVLQEKWNEAVEKGLFRYTLENLKTRTVEGAPSFIIQSNPARGQHRREPEVVTSLNQPFDSNKFNFTRVQPGEVLFALDRRSRDGKNTGEDVHWLMINVSPLEFCHVLLVPSVFKYQPQVLNLEATMLGVDVLLLSANKGLRVGFNSLCALASVNHLHLHAWYMNQRLYVEDADVKPLQGLLYETVNAPCKAFVLQLHGLTAQQFAQKIFDVVSYLQKTDVAHNLFITRGQEFTNKQNTSVRAYIWPRKKHLGNKFAGIPSFNIAVAELAGHIPVYDDSFAMISHEEIISRIQEVCLPDQDFVNLQTDLVKLFS